MGLEVLGGRRGQEIRNSHNGWDVVPLDIPFPTEVARGRPDKAIMARAPTKPGPKAMPVAA